MKKIDRFKKDLVNYKDKHLDIGMKMLKADSGKIFPVDIFYLGLMQRSISTIKGFLNEIDADNYLCSAPLIRIQLDTLLQTYSVHLVEDPDDFAFKKMKGMRTDQLKAKGKGSSRDNLLMQDKKIINEMQKDKRIKVDWIEDLYNQTSKFIHASDKHIFSTISKGDKRNEIIIQLSEKIDIPEEYILEGLAAMTIITKTLFILWEGWIQTKDKKTK